MQRRDFIAGLGSAATWSVAARAQQPPMRAGSKQANVIALLAIPSGPS
jgi:hypothetical protein